MTYKAVRITELMVHEFAQVEGAISSLDKTTLQVALPSNLNLDQFITQVHQGHWVLLSDSPVDPVFVKQANHMGISSWVLSSHAQEHLSSSAQTALLSRTNLSGSSSGSVQSRNLHQPEPMAPYVPEPTVKSPSEKTSTLKYEYCFDIACSDESFREYVGCSFVLAKTGNEEMLGNWVASKVQHGTRYTLAAAVDEPKRLVAQVASRPMGISPKQPVKLNPIGTQVALEGFVPVHPAVQLGGRLGLPTKGYYYHLHNGKLIQEYKLVGDSNWSFYGTQSSHEILDDTQAFNRHQNALLVFWKIGGKVVENQHLLYLEQQITKEQLDDLNDQWLEKHGVKIDVNALLESTQQPVEKRNDNRLDGPSSDKQPQNHTVALDSQTGQRETWAKIAQQYNLAPNELLSLNPQYRVSPMSLAIGDSLHVKKPEATKRTTGTHFGLPPVAPQSFNHPRNAFYDYSDQCLVDTEVKSINSETLTSEDIAIVNVKSERTLHIGVFFDGTGQNSPNDLYKETYGNKSRTNVARLFDAYPVQHGVSQKIYVSGVGTVDGIPITPGQRNPIIDAGEDEKLASQATGAFDDTDGLWKWQSLLVAMNDIVRQLGDDFENVQHIQFDVFGFSRGAALARHFVNVVKEGFPDYTNPSRTKSPSTLMPNLFGNETFKRFDSFSDQFYAKDSTRRTSVRFVGLFDTVGSFYLPGNEDEGNYQLKLKPNAAERVFQICAQHEYRKNFPLTSLGRDHQEATAFSDGIFFQEIFPGSHSDVGGGYPSKNQYGRTDLPARLNQPVDSTYNRKLVKRVSFFTKYKTELQTIREANAAASFTQRKLAEESQAWRAETRDAEGVHGEVKMVDGELLYYHFIPISNAVAGLAFERMKQQAELCSIAWDKNALYSQKDASFDSNNDTFINKIWEQLKSLPLGSINNQWINDESTLLHSYVHRPHDALINPGYEGLTDALVNAINFNDNHQSKREVFNNG